MRPASAYEPGDAIGVIPENDAELAAELASVVGLGGNADLVAKLTKSHDITTLTRPVVQAYAKLTGRSDVAALADAEAFKGFAADRQLMDLFAEFPETLTQEQLARAAAAAAAAPLFGRVERQGACRRNASSRQRRALAVARARSARA